MNAEVTQTLEPGNPKDFPGIPFLSVLLNFRSGTDGRFLEHLAREQEYAAESGKSLQAWLSRMGFVADDFGSPDATSNPLLIEGIVYFGLKLGCSFEFLKRNLTQICKSISTRTPSTLAQA